MTLDKRFKKLVRFFQKSGLFHYFYSSVGLIIAILLILIFRKIAESLEKPRLLYIDQSVYEMFRFVASPTTDFLAKVVTFFGSSIFVISALIISVFFLVRNHLRRASFVLAFSTLSAFLINSLLKSVFVRNRPIETGYDILWQSYSFPSGHAMVSTVFYGLLGYLLIRFEKNSSLKMVYLIFFSLLIISVALSRVALGIHYFSDVVAAIAIGGFWAIWNIYILKIFYHNK